MDVTAMIDLILYDRDLKKIELGIKSKFQILIKSKKMIDNSGGNYVQKHEAWH